MPRTLAVLPTGARITDYISLGVIAKTFPPERIEEVLRATGRASVRQRALPAHVMVYFVVALALYMQSSAREVLRCLLEGLKWLLEPEAKVHVAGDAGFARANEAGVRAIEALARRTGGSGGGVAHARGVVPAVANREHRRQQPGRSRRGGQRGGVRTAAGEPGTQRVPAAALRVAGGGRHAGAVRDLHGRVRRQGAGTGPEGGRELARRDALLG